MASRERGWLAIWLSSASINLSLGALFRCPGTTGLALANAVEVGGDHRSSGQVPACFGSALDGSAQLCNAAVERFLACGECQARLLWRCIDQVRLEDRLPLMRKGNLHLTHSSRGGPSIALHQLFKCCAVYVVDDLP